MKYDHEEIAKLPDTFSFSAEHLNDIKIIYRELHAKKEGER